MALELADRLDEILADAERKAAAAEREARHSADRYRAERREEVDSEIERRFAEGARRLREPALALARASAALRMEIERSLEAVRAAEAAAAEVLRQAGADPSHAAGAPRLVADGAAARGFPPARRSPEEAVLRAVQLAVAGKPRDEIEAALEDEFGQEAADGLVDEILDG